MAGKTILNYIQTLKKWLESMLEPERDPGVRTYRNLCYDRLHPAVEEVFGTDWRGNVNADLDLVNHILDGRKPILTMRRLGVIRNWMKADAEEQEKWRKEHEPKGEAE